MRRKWSSLYSFWWCFRCSDFWLKLLVLLWWPQGGVRGGNQNKETRNIMAAHLMTTPARHYISHTIIPQAISRAAGFHIAPKEEKKRATEPTDFHMLIYRCTYGINCYPSNRNTSRHSWVRLTKWPAACPLQSAAQVLPDAKLPARHLPSYQFSWNQRWTREAFKQKTPSNRWLSLVKEDKGNPIHNPNRRLLPLQCLRDPTAPTGSW